MKAGYLRSMAGIQKYKTRFLFRFITVSIDSVFSIPCPLHSIPLFLQLNMFSFLRCSISYRIGQSLPDCRTWITACPLGIYIQSCSYRTAASITHIRRR